MDAVITKRDAIRAIGYKIDAQYQMETAKNAAYWINVDFSKYPAYPEGLNDMAEIATWYHPEGSTEPLAYYFGTVTDYKEIPEGFTEFNIPAAEYAVFTASDTADKDDAALTAKKVADTWTAIYTDWKPAHPEYKADHTKMYFELYTGSRAEIWIPVTR
jgi:predicted transcriptional regulator YdeE